jgi:hypothetical protein
MVDSSAGWNASPDGSSDEDLQAVMATLRALFDSIANRDKEGMRATLMPEGLGVHSRDGAIMLRPLGKLPDSMPDGTAQMEERVHDVLVKIEREVAVVWAPYNFFYDGVLHHEGVNVISFMKQPDGRWLISGVTDSGRAVG